MHLWGIDLSFNSKLYIFLVDQLRACILEYVVKFLFVV